MGGLQPADVEVFPELRKFALFHMGLGVAIGSARSGLAFFLELFALFPGELPNEHVCHRPRSAM